MNTSEPVQWRQRCKELGLDPQEVKSVASRYAMYKTYNDGHGSNTLDLPRWYKWYRVEKLSEGHAMLAPPEQGCSIGPDTESPDNQRPVISEPAFLQLLEAYRASKGSR